MVIQGFGSVGWNAAKIAYDWGCKVIGVSDSSGGIYCKDGLNPYKVYEHKAKTGSVLSFKGCRNITNEELLELGCDVLVPAALENQITTPEADKVLNERGVFLIPDILANSGGVTVSYFEWVQNLTREHWTLEEVKQKLERKIVKAFNDVYKISKNEEEPMRTAALMLGVGRVAEAIKTLGLWP